MTTNPEAILAQNTNQAATASDHKMHNTLMPKNIHHTKLRLPHVNANHKLLLPQYEERV